MKRSTFKHIIYFLVFITYSIPVFSQNAYVKRVVIDAGHGGKDPGAKGKTVDEKDVVLSVALKLGNAIKENYRDVEVVYTRDKDRFIELHRRAAIANECKADLFISIHCNSNPSPRPYGAETFVMGTHKNQANLDVAKKENASILFEENYSKKYDGFDPNSPEANIIFSLYQNIYLEKSLTLASYVQNQFREKLNRFDRGVKQAGFLVLYKTTMPSILVEAGFLSNSEEEKFLATEQGQINIANSLFEAFRIYKSSIEESIVNVEDRKTVVAITDKESNNSKKDVNTAESKKEEANSKEVNKPSETSKNTKTATEEIKANTAIAELKNAEDDLIFRVQILTSPKKIPLNAPRFKNFDEVYEYKDGNIYKYTVGKYKSMEEAMSNIKNVKSRGYSDAFVACFYKGERITVQKAKEIKNKN